MRTRREHGSCRPTTVSSSAPRRRSMLYLLRRVLCGCESGSGVLAGVACIASASDFTEAVGVSGSPGGCGRGCYCPGGCARPRSERSLSDCCERSSALLSVRWSRPFPPWYLGARCPCLEPGPSEAFAEILWAPGPPGSASLALSGLAEWTTRFEWAWMLSVEPSR